MFAVPCSVSLIYSLDWVKNGKGVRLLFTISPPGLVNGPIVPVVRDERQVMIVASETGGEYLTQSDWKVIIAHSKFTFGFSLITP